MDSLNASDAPDAVVRCYYGHLNAHRVAEAAALFADAAVVQHLLFEPLTGPAGLTLFVSRWLEAFPDAQMHINTIESRTQSMCEVDVTATGTHRGLLEMGAYRFRPSGATTPIHMRHLFEVREGRIVFSGLSFDLHDFVQHLVPVNLPALQQHLDRIRQLADELYGLEGDPRQLRELLGRLGIELDGARRVLRPYYYK
jgi:hypothetical protein